MISYPKLGGSNISKEKNVKKKILVLFLLSTMILGGCSTQKITDSSSQKEEAQEAKNQDISEESTDGEADESQEASKDVFATRSAVPRMRRTI